MSAGDCIPLEQVPHTSRIFREFAEAGTELSAKLRGYYAQAPQSDEWMTRALPAHRADIAQVVALLEEQNRGWGAGAATLANLARLKNGSRCVITGQQVSLFGGPLYSLLKAASAVQLARLATERGAPTVPVFWLATEDHDFAEVNSASFVKDRAVTTLHLCDTPSVPLPVGGWVAGACMQESVNEAIAALGDSEDGRWTGELLRECYAPGVSLADAFARLFTRLFEGNGLILIDASAPGFHALARPVLAQAIADARPLHDALIARSAELEAAGYHAQVLVNESSGLLFLIDHKTGARVAVRRSAKDSGGFVTEGKHISVEELKSVLQTTPDRLSPNALLRPVMQDYLLPTSAYVGGPAEVAYYAQAEVLYSAILGTVTPILPRFSATLVTPRLLRLLKRYELSVTQTWTSVDDLAMRLGARSMSPDAKQKLQGAGSSLHTELQKLEDYAKQLDEGLGHTAEIAASKIRYQMNRLRRMMAKFELERSERLREHAETMVAYLHPRGGLQERKLSGLQFVAEQGPGLIDRLVKEAADRCPGHKVIEL